MTRKQKALRIIEWYEVRRFRQFEEFLRRKGRFKVLSDEALEEYAMFLVEDYRFSQRLNRENRKRAEARA